jgi:type I restriction enzyme S subunit
MRDGWINTPIGDIAQVLSGFAFKSDFFNESEGMPLIRIRDLSKRNHTEARYSGRYEDRYVVRQGDFLIGMDGEFHCYEWEGEDALLNQRVCRIQDFKINLVEPRFIYFAVNKYLDKIEQDTGYTTVKHISSKQILAINIPLPPLAVQKRIVDLISSIDSYINALQQQLSSAKKLRNAVLHEQLTAVANDWVETTLGEITDLVRGPFGGSLKKEIFVQEGFAVYEQQHAIYGDFSTIRYRISSEKFNEMKRFSLLPGDLIMSCSGTMGKVRIVPNEAEPGIVNQALLKIKPKSELTSGFLYLWMQSDDFIRQIEMNSAGGALQNVSSVKMLKGIKLNVPDLVEQERIIKIISTIDEVKIKTELAIAEAKSLRSGLLSDLLSGEHEIPASYDKQIGAA